MRKVASLVAAVVASLALAGPASALMTVTILGSNTPGTNTYTIVMSFGPLDDPLGASVGIRGLITSVTTTGTYTGVFTDPVLPAFATNFNGAGTLSGGPPAGTGVAGSWGSSGAVAGPAGSYTVGTIEITVGVGDVINPFVGSLDGFITNSFSTSVPNLLTGITIIPEPTTAALLGLGIVGLVVAGRRGRA